MKIYHFVRSFYCLFFITNLFAASTIMASNDLKQSNIISYDAKPQQYLLPNPDLMPIEDKITLDEKQNYSMQQPVMNVNKRHFTKVDERVLWQLLNLKEYDKLRGTIAKFQQRYKSWHPSAQLLALLHEKEGEFLISQAVETQNWQFLVDISSQYPELFSERRIDIMWLLAEAYHNIGQDITALQIYLRLWQAEITEQEKIATLYKAKELLSHEYFLELLHVVCQNPSVSLAKKIQDILYDVTLEIAIKVNSDADWKRVVETLLKIQDNILSRNDSGAALLLAWAYYELKDFSHAIFWFEQVIAWQPTDDVYRGLTLSYMQLKDYALAETYILHTDLSNIENQRLWHEILYSKARQAYLQENFEEVLHILQPLQTERSAKLLSAWALYRLHRNHEATELFYEAYAINPDNESAEGLALGLISLRDWQKFKSILSSSSTSIKPIFQKHLADSYMASRLYYASFNSISTDEFHEYEVLDNLFSSYMSFGLLNREKNGSSGTSRLSIFQIPLLSTGWWPVQNHGFEFNVARIKLDSGRLPLSAFYGCPIPDANYIKSPITHLDNLWEPYISYFHEDWWTIEAELGLTPINAPLPSRPVGKLGIYVEDTNSWKIDLYAKSIRDSLLSYVGAVDPYTGKKWGRVVATGISFSRYSGLINNWGLFHQFSLEWLSGTHVDDNWHIAFSVSLPYDLNNAAFTYASVGPSIAFEAYEHNLNHFTLGNGGYFSPQSLLNLGISGQFLTKELWHFLLKGNINAGLQFKYEAASDLFPSESCPMPMADRYGSNSTYGLGMSLELSGAYRISEKLMVSAEAAMRKSPGYDDTLLGLVLTYTFDGRNGLIQRDLKEEKIHRLY
jgi:tetratricopeptide (TPR) repeat protein